MFNKIFPGEVRERFQSWYYNIYMPKALVRNFIPLNDSKAELLKESLSKNVYSYTKSADSPEVNQLNTELATRFRNHRTRVIPWLDSVRPLQGLRILEIGCGNGTSTVALAEQGAIVTAVDIEEELLADAKERCRIFGVNASFHLMNATEISTFLGGEQYDMILFFAVLEHMTYTERITTIRQTFDMLTPGGLWCVIGTPNRLHFYDSHTAMLPFFYWLPDELAVKYAQFSPRREFEGRFEKDAESTEAKMLEFARWGRGMSYHELELALGKIDKLKIIGSLNDFFKKRYLLYRIAMNYSRNGRYSAFFQKMYPKINRSFFEPFLNFIIEK